VFGAVKFYNKSVSAVFNLQILYKSKFLVNTLFLNKYYYLNDILWQEGFLIDFAQKKTADKFVRKFLILSAYLFSERLLFDKLIRIYSDVILFISGHKTIYDFSSIANMLLFLVVLIAGLVVTVIIFCLIVCSKIHF